MYFDKLLFALEHEGNTSNTALEIFMHAVNAVVPHMCLVCLSVCLAAVCLSVCLSRGCWLVHVFVCMYHTYIHTVYIYVYIYAYSYIHATYTISVYVYIYRDIYA